STQALRDHLDFDGYGNATETSTSYGDRYKFTGREYDGDTGLQFNRSRYYDPKTGRWWSEDPLGFRAGDGNLYRYPGNIPMNATDPSGMDEEDIRYRKNLKEKAGAPTDKDAPLEEKIYSEKEAPIGLRFADEDYWDIITPLMKQKQMTREGAAAKMMMGWRDL